jgi:hypothetical protein
MLIFQVAIWLFWILIQSVAEVPKGAGYFYLFLKNRKVVPGLCGMTSTRLGGTFKLSGMIT